MWLPRIIARPDCFRVAPCLGICSPVLPLPHRGADAQFLKFFGLEKIATSCARAAETVGAWSERNHCAAPSMISEWSICAEFGEAGFSHSGAPSDRTFTADTSTWIPRKSAPYSRRSRRMNSKPRQPIIELSKKQMECRIEPLSVAESVAARLGEIAPTWGGGPGRVVGTRHRWKKLRRRSRNLLPASRPPSVELLGGSRRIFMPANPRLR